MTKEQVELVFREISRGITSLDVMMETLDPDLKDGYERRRDAMQAALLVLSEEAERDRKLGAAVRAALSPGRLELTDHYMDGLDGFRMHRAAALLRAIARAIARALREGET